MSEALRKKFTENAEQFDALMVEMLNENAELRKQLAATQAALNSQSPGDADGEPVAWAWLADNGRCTHVTRSVTPKMDGSHLKYRPLYLTPPTVQAAVAAFKGKAANLVRESLGGRAGDMLASEILALAPADAEAELEALMMKVAEEALDAQEEWPSHLTGDELRAIVQSVTRKG
jgi:hypothetical protein